MSCPTIIPMYCYEGKYITIPIMSTVTKRCIKYTYSVDDSGCISLMEIHFGKYVNGSIIDGGVTVILRRKANSPICCHLFAAIMELSQMVSTLVAFISSERVADIFTDDLSDYFTVSIG